MWNEAVDLAADKIKEEKQRKEQAAQIENKRLQDELEKQKQEAAYKERRNTDRINKLMALGLKYNFANEHYEFHDNISVNKNEVLAEDDDTFGQRITHLQTAVYEWQTQEDARKAKELKAAQVVNERKQFLFAMGFSENAGRMVFQTIDLPVEALVKMPDEEWQAKSIILKEGVQAVKDTLEVQRLIDEAAAKAEAEAGKSDKDKMLELLQDIVELRTKYNAKFKSKKYKALLENVVGLLDKVVAYINTKV
jgi:hypothetical protein